MSSPTNEKPDTLALTLAMLLLRIWLAFRAIVAGIEKFAGTAASSQAVPNWGLDLYNIMLGPALLMLLFLVLVCIATRYSVFAMGLLYTSLTFGLILLNQSAGVAWLATHIVLIVLALLLAKYNRFAILKKW
mgnify:CR=1 FL=1